MSAAALVCLNCDQEVPSGELYCCELCRQTAKLIRYGRAIHADGRINRRDVQEAFAIKIASVLGGGYPESQRKLASALRLKILDRDKRTCQACGTPGDQIDHIDPAAKDINAAANLQVLCGDCHKEKTRAQFRPITSKEEFERMFALRERIEASNPLRDCDSPDWNTRWRTIKKERRRTALQASETPSNCD